MLWDKLNLTFENITYNNIIHIYLHVYLDNGNSAYIPTLIYLLQSTDTTVNRTFLPLNSS